MKALISSVVCLVAGLAVGFFIGYRYYERYITNEAIKQMLDGMESSQTLAAARGLQAIQLIDAGNTQQVIQMSLYPVADFYSAYASSTHNDERTKEWVAKIHQFARTNQAVASQIRASTNAFFQLPLMWPNTALEPTATAPWNSTNP
jgi:hypothetical protein